MAVNFMVACIIGKGGAGEKWGGGGDEWSGTHVVNGRAVGGATHTTRRQRRLVVKGERRRPAAHSRKEGAVEKYGVKYFGGPTF
jgi:hypothetical protein